VRFKEFLAHREVRRVGLVIAAGFLTYLVFSPFLTGLLPSKQPQPPLSQSDELVRTHEVLKRTYQSYALRIESLRQLRQRGLVAGTPTAVEDEILTAARELLREHGTSQAPAIALRRLTLLAPRVTAACGKAGIVLGPNLTPELIEARLTNPYDRSRVAELVADYQFAEIVRMLVSTVADKEVSATSP